MNVIIIPIATFTPMIIIVTFIVLLVICSGWNLFSLAFGNQTLFNMAMVEADLLYNIMQFPNYKSLFTLW